MVEVATSFDIPNKLIMPALLNRETGRTAMLGLGDVVIPGLYLTYLHNLDKVVKSTAYFNSGMLAYALSFVVCALVILVFDAA